jgi:hypothetical protein
LEIVNKHHPPTLLHIKDGTPQRVVIPFLQKVKRNIIFRQAQLMTPVEEKNFFLSYKPISYPLSTKSRLCSNIRESSMTLMH